jgi:hypothetical protein
MQAVENLLWYNELYQNKKGLLNGVGLATKKFLVLFCSMLLKRNGYVTKL